jgi:hypothetical protein
MCTRYILLVPCPYVATYRFSSISGLRFQIPASYPHFLPACMVINMLGTFVTLVFLRVNSLTSMLDRYVSAPTRLTYQF